MSATTAAACVGLVVHISLENRPIRPTKSHLILPTATAAVRRSTCRDRFLSLIPSFIPDETGTSKTAMEGHRIRLQTAGRTSLSPFNHRARSLGHGCIRIAREARGR